MKPRMRCLASQHHRHGSQLAKTCPHSCHWCLARHYHRRCIWTLVPPLRPRKERHILTGSHGIPRLTPHLNRLRLMERNGTWSSPVTGSNGSTWHCTGCGKLGRTRKKRCALSRWKQERRASLRHYLGTPACAGVHWHEIVDALSCRQSLAVAGSLGSLGSRNSCLRVCRSFDVG